MNRPVLPTWGFLRLCMLALGTCVLASCKEAAAPGPNITVSPGNADLLVGESRQFTALNGGTSVVWTSSAPAVASVVKETGFVVALSRGQTTITATAGSSSSSAQVTVQAPGAIALSAPTADFAVPVGGADPAPKTVTITNGGDKPLGAMSVGAIAYGQGQPTGWLTATLSGTAPPFTLTLTPRVGTLGRGTYTAIVPVLSTGIANSPQNVAVTFAIQAPAGINVSRSTVTIPAIPAETKTETVNITNTGDVPLTGLSTAVTFTQGQPAGWLTATLNATTAPAVLTLQAVSGTLAVGTYNATVRVSSTVSGVAPKDVAVALVVSPGPSIVFTPAQVSVFANNGANAAPENVQITNGGGGTLSGLTVGAVTFGSGASNWVTVQLAGTTAPATLALNFTSSTLATGTYTATVPVSSPVASNSPRTLQIQLTIGPPPNLSLNPTSVGFSAWGAQTSVPGAQAVQVTNSTSSVSLGGLSTSISYGAGASGWLSASFQGGVNATPATILLQPNTTDLVAGTYSATVTVSTTASGVASKTVSVTYTVQTFTANVYPLIRGCASGCHFGSGPQSLNSSATSAATVYSDIAGRTNLPCYIFGACSHPGGKFNGNTALVNAVNGWYGAGAPNK